MDTFWYSWTAYVEKAWGYNAHGASGAGVRTTIGFLKDLLIKIMG